MNARQIGQLALGGVLAIVVLLAIGVALLGAASDDESNSVEQTQDTVASFLRPSANISLTYDDNGGSLTVEGSGGPSGPQGPQDFCGDYHWESPTSGRPNWMRP